MLNLIFNSNFKKIILIFLIYYKLEYFILDAIIFIYQYFKNF